VRCPASVSGDQALTVSRVAAKRSLEFGSALAAGDEAAAAAPSNVSQKAKLNSADPHMTEASVSTASIRRQARQQRADASTNP
jgi:hypothetical protein